MDPNDIRRWVENHRAAAKERELAREQRLTPQQSFAAAMALLVFDEAMNGSPFGRVDPVSEREDEEARAAWAKLRERWPRGG